MVRALPYSSELAIVSQMRWCGGFVAKETHSASAWGPQNIDDQYAQDPRDHPGRAGALLKK
jgi:hypothetical protein